MYVNNGKISNRQIFRLYVFDLMGIATLLLPPYLAKLCGVDGIWAILLGTGCGVLYLFYLGWVMQHMQTDLLSYLRENVSGWIRKIVLGFVMFHSIWTAGFCAYVFANLMQYSLVKETSIIVVLFIIVAVAAYAVSGGIESRARVYEVVFWFVLIPYVAMMLASVKSFELTYMDGLFVAAGTDIGKGTYLVFLFLTPLLFSLFLIGEKEKNYGKSMIKTVLLSIVVSAIILLGSYILLVGNFGEKSLTTMKYPVVTLMSTVQFEGNFLKRMDALMLAVWFFTLYALLNLHLHYGVSMLKALSEKENESENKKQKVKTWQLLLAATVVFVIACGMQVSFVWLRTFVNYYSYIAVPIMIIGPGVLLLVRRKKNDRK